MTVKVPLTRGLVAIIDDCDADLAEQKWYATFSGYAMRTAVVNGRKSNIVMHRIILERKLNCVLTEEDVTDHIDRDRLNNTRANLRICTQHQNSLNTSPRIGNASGYKGVTYSQQRRMYIASIKGDGKSINLGAFPDPVTAAMAYDQAARKYFGEFAFTNFSNVSETPIVRVKRPTIEERIVHCGYAIDGILSEISDEGVALATIAERFNVSVDSIRRLLVKHGYIREGSRRTSKWTKPE